MATPGSMLAAFDPSRGHQEERAAVGSLVAATAPQKGDAALFRLFNTPLETWSKIVATGAAKAKYSWPKKILLSFLAGVYLSFGMAFAFLVGGQLKSIKTSDPGLFNVIYGFFGLPFGLTMIILMGACLFTSDVTFMFAAWIEGKATAVSAWWNCIWCWFGNLFGSLWMVQLFIWGDIFHGREDFVIQTTIKKTQADWGVTFVRGMLCNWLVNIAVWQAMSAQDVTGKFVGVLIPVTIFVACGFEHCIANQYGISLGVRLGTGDLHPVDVNREIVRNLIPVTLGNTTAAMIFIVIFYFFSIGSGHDKLVNTWNSLVYRYLPSWMANMLQTGDNLYGPDGSLQPYAAKFIGDISIHGNNSSSGRHGSGFMAVMKSIGASLRGNQPSQQHATVSVTNCATSTEPVQQQQQGSHHANGGNVNNV